MFWATRRNTHTGSLGFSEELLSLWRGEMGLLLNTPGLTVIRFIISLYYRAVAADDTITQFFVGLKPSPISVPPPTPAMRTQPQQDWVLNTWISFVQERAEGTPTQNLMYQRFWDLKVARKLPRGEETLWLVAESENSDTIDYAWHTRLLLKMP